MIYDGLLPGAAEDPGPIGTRLRPSQQQETKWPARAAATFLRQAAAALFIFGLIAYVTVARPPYEPVVRRLVTYGSQAHHTYDDVVDWTLALRNWQYPTNWQEVQQVWRRLLPTRPEASDGDTLPPWSLIWPAHGEITSGFGWRTHPVHNELSYHTGIDIGAPEGSEVVAARQGRVEETGEHEIWGNYVLLVHDDQVSTFYAHLGEITVSQGQQLERGQMLGTVGGTGQVSEAHLHFEMRDAGHPVDPEPLLRAVSEDG